MKDGGTDPDHGDGDQYPGEIGRIGEQDNPDHTAGERNELRIGFGMLVGVQANDGLKNGGSKLKTKCNEPDLGEAQCVVRLQNRVNRGDDRLIEVIEQVAYADR